MFLCPLQNSSTILEENTLKHYYFPLSDDDESDLRLTKPLKIKRTHSSSSLDDLFEKPAKKKKKVSSCVGRACRDGGMTYISTNTDDGAQATHFVKIEVYDLKKLGRIPPTDHWKHATTRIKYYAANHRLNKVNEVIYDISKEIADAPDVKKYHFDKNT